MKLSVHAWIFTVFVAAACATGVGAEALQLAPTMDPFAEAPITLVGNAGAAGCYDGGNCDNNGACCNTGGSCCGYSRHVGRDFLVCRDRCPGVIGGVDVIFLRPYGSGTFAPPPSSATLFDNGPGFAQLNLEASWRTWIGYQNCDGLGARLRYWEIDRGDINTTGTGTAAVARRLGVEFRTIDAEMTQAVDFRRWNFLFAGGLRYAETGYDQSVQAGGGAILGVNQGFDGCGLTTAAQATRDLNHSGSLRMTMGARWSAVFGNAHVNTLGAAAPVGAPITQVKDDLVNILELNFGPQYRRCLGNGAYLTLGTGLEAQYWSNAIPGASFSGSGPDIGFFGVSTSVAITR